MINLLVVFVFALINGVNFSVGWLTVIPLFLELFLFSAGIAFILATLFVKYRDIGPIWEVVMQAGMYATPIIYSLTFILQRGQVKIAKLMMLNPLAQIIQDLRHFIVFSGSLRGWDLIGHNYAIIPYFLPFIIFAIGYYIFHHQAKKLGDSLMTEKKIAVKVDHVSKFFKLPVESTQSLRTKQVNRFKGIKGYKEQHVLKDIDFEVEEGDFFGIVGRNGSGKSTLLKIISSRFMFLARDSYRKW